MAMTLLRKEMITLFNNREHLLAIDSMYKFRESALHFKFFIRRIPVTFVLVKKYDQWASGALALDDCVSEESYRVSARRASRKLLTPHAHPSQV